MKRSACTWVVLAGFVLCVPDACADEVLRWKFRQGQQLHYTRTWVREITPADRAAGKRVLTRVLEMTLVVQRVHADGSARFRQTLDRVRYLKQSSAGSLEYDSTSG